jgi:signal peptidase I
MKTVSLVKALGVPLQWKGEVSARNAMTLITVSSSEGEKSVLISSRGLQLVKASDYVMAPKERIISTSNQIKDAISVGVKVSGWALVSIMIAFAGVSTLGLVDARVVLTESMSPSINAGDVVIATPPDRKTPQIGDVVVYTGKKFDGTEVAPFAHRVIGGDSVSGFVVKGDNNPSPDVQKPKVADIEAVVLFTIPLLGKLLSPQVLILLLVAGFGIWLIVDAFRDEE